MRIYRIHPDRMNYQLPSITTKAVLSTLGPDYPFHIDPTPRTYSAVWKTMPVSYYDSTEGKQATNLPDISIESGRLFLSIKAYNALKDLLDGDGEFLSAQLENTEGYIFNPLAVAEDVGGLNKVLSRKNEWEDLQSLAFFEDKVKAFTVFKCEYEGFLGLFCSDEFKNAIQSSQSNGLCFGEDLGNIFPPDASADQPGEH